MSTCRVPDSSCSCSTHSKAACLEHTGRRDGERGGDVKTGDLDLAYFGWHGAAALVHCLGDRLVG